MKVVLASVPVFILYHAEFIGVLSITSITSEQRDAKVDCPGVADGTAVGVAADCWAVAIGANVRSSPEMKALRGLVMRCLPW